MSVACKCTMWVLFSGQTLWFPPPCRTDCLDKSETKLTAFNTIYSRVTTLPHSLSIWPNQKFKMCNNNWYCGNGIYRIKAICCQGNNNLVDGFFQILKIALSGFVESDAIKIVHFHFLSLLIMLYILQWCFNSILAEMNIKLVSKPCTSNYPLQKAYSWHVL